MAADQYLITHAIGFLAAGLVFSSFYMRTMVPLRVVAISSNIAFLIYAGLLSLWPIVILHGTLLPLNIWRLFQMQRMRRELRSVRVGNFDLNTVMALMRRETHRCGSLLFARDDLADKAYYIAHGTISLPDIPAELGEGDLFGEVGLFSSGKRRLSAALCKTDVILYSIDEGSIASAFQQHPAFAFYLISLISDRLNANHRRLIETLPEGELVPV